MLLDGLWGLINNAGWATFGEIEWVSMETYRKIMEVNVFGLIRGTQLCLPLIRKAKGRVVTITSGLARMAVPTRFDFFFTFNIYIFIL
jgi:3-hydroxybutyrate dehydrogenase